MGAVGQRPGSERNRLLALDILRALAVFLVLGRHLGAAPPDYPGPVRCCFDAWLRGGWVGVDLFFVLSGFLVSGLLFAEHRVHGRLALTRFYARRGFKIYPAFFLLIGITLLVLAVFNNRPERLRILSEVCFLQSYLPGLWDHTWSLAVEEHFYLLLPLLVLGLARCRPGRPIRSSP